MPKKKPYLARHLCNQMKKLTAYNEQTGEGMLASTTVRNIIVNGVKVGCSGHFTNSLTGTCVYVSTEKPVAAALSDKNLVRYAKDAKDFSSISLGVRGRNVFVEDAELPMTIFNMLKEEPV